MFSLGKSQAMVCSRIVHRVVSRSTRLRQNLSRRSVVTSSHRTQGKEAASLFKPHGAGLIYPPLYSASGYVNNDPKRYYSSSSLEKYKETKLVIFDKDGTLVTFGSGWTTWSVQVAKEIEAELQMEGIAEKILLLWGYDIHEDKWGDGLMCETVGIIMDTMYEFYLKEGVPDAQARKLADQASYPDTATAKAREKTTGIGNPRQVCTKLKERGIKIGVATTDNRDSCEFMLQDIGIADLVDFVVCGNDPGGKPKPDPYNIHQICEAVGVPADKALMVGDTKRDIDMGRLAGCLGTVGVASGVGTMDELSEADIKCENIYHLLDIILGPDGSGGGGGQDSGNIGQQTRSYSTSCRSHTYKAGLLGHSRRRFSTQIGEPTAEYDYVIVGAGSAGCVLANRLSSRAENDVFLLEAGGKDRSWKFHMPAALMYTLMDPRYNWCYYTEPQRNCDNRRMYWPRGKVWGGSSSHNAMVYIRGHALDYDRWESQGAAGWSYADCLPYFRKAQTHDLGPNEYRGGDGPMYVSRSNTGNPLHEAFIQAGVQAGYPRTEDCNGFQQEGFGPYEMTIQAGKRSSTSRGYLRPALDRKNLSTQVKTLVRRVLFEGKKAVGVEYQQGNKITQVRARKEVILSAGAINSPHVLMLSGVGNADHLKEHGIPVVHHLPGVGENLQDHLEVYIQYKCKKPVTLYKYQWKFPHYMIKTGVEWFLFQTGNAATTHMESGAFIRTQPGVEHPDIQFHFLPSAILNHGQEMVDCHGFQAHVGTLRATSVGNLRLKSADPAEFIRMDPNYLDTEKDKQDFRHLVKLAREVFAQKAFDEYRGEELRPGPDVQTESQIDAFVRAKSDTAYHPSCTCKIGAESDPMAVVDPECRVYGMENLRVVDASVMPSVISGNLNGPTVMIAEKAADVILGNPALPKSTAPYWKPQTLETQRGY